MISKLSLLILLFIPFATADQFIFNDSLYGAQELYLDIAVTGELGFTGSPSSVTAALEYFPIDIDGQDIEEVQYSPTPRTIDEVVTYTWNDPRSAVSFRHDSLVQSFYNRPPIRKEIPFPFEVPDEQATYLQSSEIIRVTDDIAQQASSIIGSEDDAVRVAFLLGAWVNENIEYDLNSVTEDASQTSQWVLENGYGVCDELTSLFIALLRSQGIPARFVSGVAYTNLEGLESPWGPHGWAEVWFPDVGWVPYDVTYGQFGFVDATHIAFKTTVDAKTNAAEYSMRSRGGQLQPQGIDTDVQVRSASGTVPQFADIEVEAALEYVGFGSANRIDVTITNTQNTYVSTELHLARTSRLTAEDYDVPLLLGPEETRTISWYVTVADDLESGFVYTFPIIVYTNDNQRYTTEFSSTRTSRSYDLDDLGYSETAPVSTALACEYKTAIQLGEEFWVRCTNTGEQVCIEEICGDAEATYTTLFTEPGAQTLQATSDETQRFITVLVQDQASLQATLTGPSSVEFTENVTLEIVLTPTSQSIPTDVVATLKHPLFSQELTAESLTREQVLSLPLQTQFLVSGENEFVLETNYGTQETYVLVVTADAFENKITLWLNSLSAWVNSLISS